MFIGECLNINSNMFVLIDLNFEDLVPLLNIEVNAFMLIKNDIEQFQVSYHPYDVNFLNIVMKISLFYNQAFKLKVYLPGHNSVKIMRRLIYDKI
jgi:hypothetical protein